MTETTTPAEHAPSPEERGPVIRLGISSCLLGEEVRFNGGHKKDRFLVQTLGEYVEWHRVCPEVEMGLGVPRESLRLIGDVERPRMVAPKSGTDHTEAMEGWARARLEDIARRGLHGFVLKKASPSCGLFRVKVYDKNTVPRAVGRGVFARMLGERLPLLPLEEEGRLHDPRLRENFIERIFTYERWTRMLEERPEPAGLVDFHTRHKLTVLSHSPDHYRRLGRLVAEAGTRDWAGLIDEYSRILAEGLAVLATRGRHTNTLHHAMGFLKEHVDGGDKAELTETVDSYRRGLLPLVVPLTLLQHHLRKHDVPDWIRDQVYLNPYPRELMLRNHV